MFVALWLQVDVRMWCGSFVHRVPRCCSQCSLWSHSMVALRVRKGIHTQFCC